MTMIITFDSDKIREEYQLLFSLRHPPPEVPVSVKNARFLKIIVYKKKKERDECNSRDNNYQVKMHLLKVLYSYINVKTTEVLYCNFLYLF